MVRCLPKQNRENLKNALREGEITMDSLYRMTSTERRDMLGRYVGDDMASMVNGKFEQAMLSNQKNSLANWIRQTVSHKSPIRREMLKRVERNEEVLTPQGEKGFLNDLVKKKLGVEVTEEEADALLSLKQQIDEFKAKWDPNKAQQELVNNPASKNAGWASEADRMSYGFALDDFKTFSGNLQKEAGITIPERFKLNNQGENIRDIAGATKSIVASLDNSFIGRQGIKMLFTRPTIWAKNGAQSFKLLGQELKAKAPKLFGEREDSVMRSVRAEILSRPNAMNGKYTAAKNGYGLGVVGEEAFPSSLPSRMPVLGRLFKASETAYNSTALKMRADLADAVIAQAEKAGVDMLDEVQASAHARVVSSMTGRGDIRKLSTKESTDWGNVLFFSLRFLKSNWDTLTAHQFDRLATPESKKLAAKNLMKIAAGLGSVLLTAKMINPDSVDMDPRKGRFGKIRIGDTDIDITGGMGGLITFASRALPITKRNGEWGAWTYSKTTKKWTNTFKTEFGQRTAFDTIENFITGKASPAAGAVRDVLKGRNFNGEKPNFVNTTIGLVTPISVEMLQEELHKGNDDILMVMMAESLGFSPTSTTLRGYGVRWDALREKVDTKELNSALKEVSEIFNKRAERLENSPRFERMDNEQRSKELDAIRRQATDQVLGRYGL